MDKYIVINNTAYCKISVLISFFDCLTPEGRGWIHLWNLNIYQMRRCNLILDEGWTWYLKHFKTVWFLLLTSIIPLAQRNTTQYIVQCACNVMYAARALHMTASNDTQTYIIVTTIQSV
jgi:hypothetical protein